MPDIVPYRTGPFALDPQMGVLRGPLGDKELKGQKLTILEALMRRPGVVVSSGELISALYPDPDLEPDFALANVKVRVNFLRGIFKQLGDQDRRLIRTIHTVGYAMERLPLVQP